MQSISLLKISFSYPGADELFSDLSIVIDDTRHMAVVGDNGIGKTTLLRIIADQLQPTSGKIVRNASVYLMPQISAPDAKSGGERQQQELKRAFESGADILLLDEPTNNLDADARSNFFVSLQKWPGGAIIITHDRQLLNQIDTIIEMSKGRLRTYGGNYDFYRMSKESERQKLESEYTNAEKRIGRLNKTKQIAQATMYSHLQKQSKEKSKGGQPKIVLNAVAGKSAETAGKAVRKIDKKLDEQFDKRQEITTNLRDDHIKIPLPAKPFPKKDLIMIDGLSFGYDQTIFENFSFHMRGCERIRIAGGNGCGKTTLLKLIMGRIQPDRGHVKLGGRAAYLDQDLSLLDKNKSIVDNIIDFTNLNINQAHAIAANFGFRAAAAHKRVAVLSGGELLKATLATVLGSDQQPDLLILDEPTNNLDIKSIDILEEALNQYRGAILLISHDDSFIKSLEIHRTLWL